MLLLHVISLSLVKSLRCLASLVVGHFLFLGIFGIEELLSSLLDSNAFCFLLLYRRRRQRPELRGLLLGAADVGPSLSQPRWVSGSAAEGMGDGRPSLLGQMQPLEEE